MGLPRMPRKNVRVPTKLFHPGQFVRTEILNELKLTIAKAAEVLGVRTATLSDLVNEKAALSPEMAIRLEVAFGVSADDLLRMQAWHDAKAVRAKAGQLNVKRYEPEHA